MIRLAAVLVLLLAALSLVTSATAYRVAQPTSGASVPVVSTSAGTLRVAAGTGSLYGWATDPGGQLLLDLRKGPDGSTNYGFDPGATYTLNRIVTITNASATTKSVTIAVSGNTLASASFSGYIGGVGTALTPPWSLPAGQFVEVNLALTAGAATGAGVLTFTVDGY